MDPLVFQPSNINKGLFGLRWRAWATMNCFDGTIFSGELTFLKTDALLPRLHALIERYPSPIVLFDGSQAGSEVCPAACA